ncbi:MAG: glycosyltransferase [Lachnospiraceae bacterium]|jgi:glycosyltransferase involved in cell wall biosynthesis|nr:glycosyltransferase [Lachnospiraceae bacterium]
MKNNFPLVSITLLTYNHEQYIEDCILGIIEQNYPNIELIILDDASKDRTVEIIDSYQKELKEKLHKVTFLKRKRNSGNIPHNVNSMLKKVRGIYCKLMSGDDIMAYNCISKLVECFMIEPQCSVVYSNGYVINDRYRKGTQVSQSNKLYFYRSSGVIKGDLFRKLMFGNSIAAPTVMIKREVFEKYGFFDESISYEDYEYWLRISYNKVKFYYLDQCLVYYRRGNTSITNFFSEGKKRKIIVSMLSNGKTLNKYIAYLSEDDKLKCKKLYYYKYLKLCWEAKFLRGFFSILNQMNHNGIEISFDFLKKESIEMQREKNAKQQELIFLLEKWISLNYQKKEIIDFLRERNYRSIAIYGAGCVALKLCEAFKDTEMEIQYLIDQNADMILSDFSIYTLDNELKQIDAIIVTPLKNYDQIIKDLSKKVTCPIIHIKDIIYTI